MYSPILILPALAFVAAQPGPPAPTHQAFPPSCGGSCAPALAIFRQCGNPGNYVSALPDDDDGDDWDDWDDWYNWSNTTYTDCVCNANNAGTDIPACYTCWRNAPGDHNDDDWDGVISRCNFPTSALASGATPTPTGALPTTPPPLSSSYSTIVYTTTYADDDDDDDDQPSTSTITSSVLVGIGLGTTAAEATPTAGSASSTTIVSGGTTLVSSLAGTPTSPSVATQTLNAGTRAQLPLWAAGVGALVAGLVF